MPLGTYIDSDELELESELELDDESVMNQLSWVLRMMEDNVPSEESSEATIFSNKLDTTTNRDSRHTQSDSEL